MRLDLIQLHRSRVRGLGFRKLVLNSLYPRFELKPATSILVQCLKTKRSAKLQRSTPSKIYSLTRLAATLELQKTMLPKLGLVGTRYILLP